MIEAEPSWNYLASARTAVGKAHDILDVATGGGEIFASLAPFPGRATAVEGYAPNVAVARARLNPLGVSVFRGSTRTGMPFVNDAFDLVLNRHGGFRPAEMHRILKPGGVFLTQQVGGDNLFDLVAEFGAKLVRPENTLAQVREGLVALGFEIRDGREWRGPVEFFDVGALVYFLKAIPWVVEGFDVDRHLEILRSFQARISQGQPLRFTYTRFLIDALKP